MLMAIETLLETPLRQALGDGVGVALQPAERAPADAAPLVSLCARTLQRHVPPLDSAEAEDRPSRPQALRLLTLQPDAGDARRYPLPAGTGPQVSEVQSPPGWLLPAHDAWEVEGDALRLRAAPKGPVLVLLKGAPVRGLAERAPVQVELALAVWALAAAQADRLLAQALAALFKEFNGRDLVTLTEGGAIDGLWLRLERPRVLLSGVERDMAARNGGGDWQRLTATLLLRGELATTLALEPVPDGGRIAGIALEVAHIGADGQLRRDRGTLGEAAD
ncbi:hypothetical protein [Azohydromonas caseinilytica]|uniref:Uncharacterized protein n=1 Tax=Azohydromonas caseinilytica TaxID=2728836 RepID=A0A848F1Y6_9BURK|nr:hypothetical protein [Azohydromonas caseinilytica]NML13694.1 hypothetical protein [Azohydromonas caseinilytica]